MPRIRTIKPEFFTSPSTAKASHTARLLFIAMWCWADDHGRGELNLLQLRAFAFPEDDPDLDAWMAPHDGSGGTSDGGGGNARNFRDCVEEVCGSFGVVVYEHSGRRYFEIPSWEKHQKSERKAKSKYPAPGDEHSQVVEGFAEMRGNSSAKRGSSVRPRGNTATGTGEQGNRGTGEQEEVVTVVGNVAGARVREAEPAPSPKNIPEEWVEEPWLARCAEHRHVTGFKACGRCATLREAAQAEQKRREMARTEATKKRKAAIAACQRCDERGMFDVPGGAAARCPHTDEGCARIWEAAEATLRQREAEEENRRVRANSTDTFQGRWRQRKAQSAQVLEPGEKLPPGVEIIDHEENSA